MRRSRTSLGRAVRTAHRAMHRMLQGIAVEYGVITSVLWLHRSRGALCIDMDDGKPGVGPGGGDNRPTSHECAFDAVLGPDCSGRQVYEEIEEIAPSP